MTRDTSRRDAYAWCERGCNHDLARGILVSDLLSGDGPHPPEMLVASRFGTIWLLRSRPSSDVEAA